MAYDLSFMDNSTTLLDVTVGVNTATGGVMGLFMIGILYIGLLAYLTRNNSFDNSMVGAGFICSIISGLTFFIGLVAWWGVTIFLVLFILSIIKKQFS